MACSLGGYSPLLARDCIAPLRGSGGGENVGAADSSHMNIRNESGRDLDATFSVAEENGEVVLYYESRGPGRNIDYNLGLELLFARFASLPAIISDASVASRETEGLPLRDRRIKVDGYSYPLDVRDIPDILRFRRAFGAAQARVGRDPRGAEGSGNPTKRVRLVLSFPAAHPPAIEDLTAHLAGPTAGGRNYWALCVNPDIYRLTDAVRDLRFDLWTSKGRPINAGDRAIVWQAQGGGARRGIVALAEVLEPPREIPDTDNPFWVDPNAGSEVEPRVKVRYVIPARLPLWLSEPGNDFLDDLSVARARGGTVFRITPEQWSEVVEAAGGWKEITPPSRDLIDELEFPHRSPRQGRVANSAVRKAIEEYAMQRAKAYFSSRWTSVKDVSRRACFDLLCRQDSRELRVEVKGTTGDGDAVLVTRNEVDHAVSATPMLCSSSPAALMLIASRIRLAPAAVRIG
jgi:hypothetical protein